ncbi:hypothetical protein [Amycolatopsis sp. NPDC051102]|uniref:hypothetical protein n=1 Tax=Amycolatopsis sp. NPDC051102 TaxID=3155163 RepID=UPI003431E147
MTFFDIEGYEPHWLAGRQAITAAHAARLAALVGRWLSSAWLAWDGLELGEPDPAYRRHPLWGRRFAALV